jgi:hypothetical protein
MIELCCFTFDGNMGLGLAVMCAPKLTSVWFVGRCSLHGMLPDYILKVPYDEVTVNLTDRLTSNQLLFPVISHVQFQAVVLPLRLLI